MDASAFSVQVDPLREDLICSKSAPPQKEMAERPGPGSRKTVEALEKLLSRDRDYRVRLAAARALGRSGKRSSSPALIKALDDAIPSVRHAAIVSLGKTGGVEATEALKKLLESKSCCVRGLAARALLKITGLPLSNRDNLELLTKLLCSGEERVKDAILEIGEPAIAVLTYKLDDESFSVRQQAAQTLALHLRRTLDQRPPEEAPLTGLGVSAQKIASLYSFRITRKGGIVEKVENSGFDAVSRTLCGNRILSSILPLSGSPERESQDADIEAIDLKSLLEEHGAGSWRRMGRTLVAPLEKGCLAVKLCLGDDDKIRLSAEAGMQKHLQSFRLSSRLPRPLGGLFRIDGLPAEVRADLKISEPHGICYTAERDYFVYLNDPRLSSEDLKRGMSASAQDLARLARMGLVHASLIPLFHNRERTPGCGTYRWNRKLAGRLESWLESCQYPNLRLSGIADLEHMELHQELSSQELQALSGEHLLSLSLVLGSYFRRRGEFDRKAIGSILRDCFQKYYCALKGRDTNPLDGCIDWQALAGRMAEEMEGNQCGREAPGGYHLGKQNGPFPIPELIRAIHLTSLFAVLDVQAECQARNQSTRFG